MAYYVYVNKDCTKCGNNVTQIVWYDKQDKKIQIKFYWRNCPVCKGFLTKPTIEEMKENPYFRSENSL